MDVDLLKQIDESLRQSAVAIQEAKQSKRRTEVLIAQAKRLLLRFDQLRYRALVNLDYSHRRLSADKPSKRNKINASAE
jgi:hypothetical protein